MENIWSEMESLSPLTFLSNLVPFCPPSSSFLVLLSLLLLLLPSFFSVYHPFPLLKLLFLPLPCAIEVSFFLAIGINSSSLLYSWSPLEDRPIAIFFFDLFEPKWSSIPRILRRTSRPWSNALPGRSPRKRENSSSTLPSTLPMETITWPTSSCLRTPPSSPRSLTSSPTPSPPCSPMFYAWSWCTLEQVRMRTDLG